MMSLPKTSIENGISEGYTGYTGYSTNLKSTWLRLAHPSTRRSPRILSNPHATSRHPGPSWQSCPEFRWLTEFSIHLTPWAVASCRILQNHQSFWCLTSRTIGSCQPSRVIDKLAELMQLANIRKNIKIHSVRISSGVLHQGNAHIDHISNLWFV